MIPPALPFVAVLMLAAPGVSLLDALAVERAILGATDDELEQRTLARIAALESGLRADVADCRVRGDAGRALGAWQIHPRSREEARIACGDLDGQVALALARVRESIVACRHLPERERLAIFTGGSCANRGARRASRARWGSP